MRTKILSVLLLVVLSASAACSTQPAQPAVTAVMATHTPVVKHRLLTVLAAASLTQPFTEIGQQFEAKNPGAKIMFNFAGSQQLAQQLDQGAPADVFASANQKYMDGAIASGRVEKDAFKVFAYNGLVVIYPKDNPVGLSTLTDLAKPGLRIDLAAKEVPAGEDSLDFLDKAANDPAFGGSFKDDVLKNVVSYEDDVKAVLTKVSLSEADAGIVYLSDISQDAIDKIGKLDIPAPLNVIATYPVAAIQNSKNPEMAKSFIDLLLSAEGQKVLEKYNFVPVDKLSTAWPVETVAPGAPFTVTDALGRSVTLQSPPQRIALAGKANLLVADAVYMFPEAVERVAVLGKGTQGTGNFLAIIDPQYDSKPRLENEVGPEQIAAEQPDAVILKSYLAEKLGAPLEALGLPVIYVDFETPEQYARDLKTLGQLFQDEARAQQVAGFYSSRVDWVTQRVSGLADAQKPKVLLLYYNDQDGTAAFNVPPMSWMQTILVQTAGGLPVWKDANLGNGWTKVTLEQIAAWDADQVFIISYFKPVDEVVAGLKADPQWQAMRAVQEGKLYGFATDLMSWDQADARWILGLAWLAGKLHPDRFADLDIQDEARTFYSELYGLSDETFQKDILPMFSGDLP